MYESRGLSTQVHFRECNQAFTIGVFSDKEIGNRWMEGQGAWVAHLGRRSCILQLAADDGYACIAPVFSATRI